MWERCDCDAAAAAVQCIGTRIRLDLCETRSNATLTKLIRFMLHAQSKSHQMIPFLLRKNLVRIHALMIGWNFYVKFKWIEWQLNIDLLPEVGASITSAAWKCVEIKSIRFKSNIHAAYEGWEKDRMGKRIIVNTCRIHWKVHFSTSHCVRCQRDVQLTIQRQSKQKSSHANDNCLLPIANVAASTQVCDFLPLLLLKLDTHSFACAL